MLEVEIQLMSKRKEKIERFEKENQKLKERLYKNKSTPEVKKPESELNQIRDDIERNQKEIRQTITKIRDTNKRKEVEKCN